MFKKFFAALSSLTESVLTLKASVDEANTNLRENLGLDHGEEKPALGHNGNGRPRHKEAVRA